MFWLMGFGSSFITTLAYGMLFNAPVRTLLASGIVGMVGWGILSVLPLYGAAETFSTFAAATFVSISSQMLSIRFKVPSTNFSVAGIIPLVPGSLAYRSMLAFVSNEYLEGITLATRTMMKAGAIAAGLILGLSIFSVWKGIVTRNAGKSAEKNK